MLKLDVFFDDTHESLRIKVSRFVAASIAPLAKDDESEVERNFRRYLALLAEHNLLSLVVAPVQEGPPLLSLRSVCLVREALSYASPLADLAFVMQGLGTYPVALAGDLPLKQSVLSQASRGELIAAFALTEPEAGSDVASLKARARLEKDHYVLSGEKVFISNAPFADGFTVFASTNPEAGAKGISAFWVPFESRGLSIEWMELISPHPIGRVFLRDVVVPKSARLGAEGEGLKIALKTLDFFRSSVGAAANGMARRALDEAINYAQRRFQFGKPLSEQQSIQMKIARMATELDAARLLVYRAAYKKDRGVERIPREAAMAKLFATETASRVIDEAVQIHGGLGLVKNSIPERLYRDIRALRIYEGTSEVLQLVIARDILKG